MNWRKKGLIYCPSGERNWQDNTVLTPTPYLLNDETIRIFCGFRDNAGVSRIGYLDVSASQPSNILAVSASPVIELGRPGTFDDNGMILGDVIKENNRIRMYYVGFQKVEKIKFLAFSGCALSDDGGETFYRLTEVPIMDRADEGLYIRAIHSVIKENETWKFWYSVGNGWEVIRNTPYPRYNIRYTESDDGLHFDSASFLCLDCGENEYRIGRPRVRQEPFGYSMMFTSDTVDKQYRAGYASSTDGVTWVRDDSKLGIKPSPEGWDSEMLCYPAVIEANGRRFMFYSGNGMGATGVGYAELEL